MAFIKSLRYAARGIWYCVRHERNFRIHLCIGAYVFGFAPYFSLNRAEWAALLVLTALVLCAEAVNTAVERAVDLASMERRPLAGPLKTRRRGRPALRRCRGNRGLLFLPAPTCGGILGRTFSRIRLNPCCFSSPFLLR